MNSEELEKMFNKLMGKQEFVNDLIDLMAITGDPQMLYLQAEHSLGTRLTHLDRAIAAKQINTEQIKQLTNLLKQFSELLDDFLKENNIKL